MAVTYIGYDGDGYAIEVDFTNNEINCSNDIDTLLVQDLNNVIREAEASPIGMCFDTICNTSGKEDLDVDNGVQVGITLELLGNWLVYSEKTSGRFRVTGGNLLRSDGEDPFKENTLVSYVNIQSAASTIVSVSSGSGLSTAEHNQLMALPTTTLESDERSQLLAIPTETLTSAENTQLFAIPTDTVSINQQDVRDALTLASSDGGGVAGSIDRLLKDIHAERVGNATLNTDKTEITYEDENGESRIKHSFSETGRVIERL